MYTFADDDDHLLLAGRLGLLDSRFDVGDGLLDVETMQVDRTGWRVSVVGWDHVSVRSQVNPWWMWGRRDRHTIVYPLGSFLVDVVLFLGVLLALHR